MRDRLVYIDALRALAILFIVFGSFADVRLWGGA